MTAKIIRLIVYHYNSIFSPSNKNRELK